MAAFGNSPQVDRQGNTVTGDGDAVALLDRAMDRLLRFNPEGVDIAAELVQQSAPIPMAHVLWAYLYLMSTDADDLGVARSAAAALETSDANERERAHADAINAWLSGNWEGAAARLDALLFRWPTDALALMLGHQLDFFLGDAQNLRDRPARTLREIDPDHPSAAFARGMMAFGLEEAGHYTQALDAGLAAVDTNPDDVWGVHAVVHTYEMLGRVDEGLRFLASDRTDWEAGNLLAVHNWWHRALFHLEAGQTDKSLAIYDEHINNDRSAGVPMELLDASSLLWRLWLDGIDTGDRFATLARSWSAKVDGEPWYVFNDLHAAMAFAGAAQLHDLRALIDRHERWLSSAVGTNARMTAEIGLPVARSLLAFAEGRHDDVIELLFPVRRTFQRSGGSHAQRDALQRTLLESSLRSGRFDVARALADERLGVREASPYSWTQRARALRGLGAEQQAADAERTGAEHRTRFATVSSSD